MKTALALSLYISAPLRVAAEVALVTLAGPDGQTIDVNPAEVVSLREPRGQGHFAAEVHCLVHTADGKFIAVVETCEAVRKRIEEER